MHEQELILGENTKFHGQIYLNQLSIDHLKNVNANLKEDAERSLKLMKTIDGKLHTSQKELQALKIKYEMTKTNLDAQITTLKNQSEQDNIKLRKNKTLLKLIPTLEDKCDGLEKKLIHVTDERTKLHEENAVLRSSKQQLEISLAEKIATISQINLDLEDQKQIDQELMFLMEKKKAKKK